MKVVAAWSGGKDSCFAYYKAKQLGLDFASFLTFMHNAKRTNFHAIPTEVLDAQAEAIDVPLTKKVTTPRFYEKQFKDALLKFKEKGVEGLVTGDIYEVAGHEEKWLERVCSEIDFTPIRPLWQGNTTQIFRDFITAGFKATVVRTKLDVLGKEWLGRELNESFLIDIAKLHKVDPCGEGGEYHTVVTDGPVFHERLDIQETRKLSRAGYGLLDIVKFKKTRK
jgi:diphthine-ammonia ligase